MYWKHIIFIIYGKCIDGNLGGFCRQAARCAISGEFEGGENKHGVPFIVYASCENLCLRD